MVQRIFKFEIFALDKDSMFALGILSNLTNGLETLSVEEEEGFVLGLSISFLAASFLESVFVESWFNCSVIVFRMAFV